MNNITKAPPTPVRTARGSIFNAVAGALALLCAASALAAPITFETIAPVGYAAGETVNESGFNILMLDGPYGGANGVVMDSASCAVAACPTGASGQYLGILNDGGVNFALTDTAAWGFSMSGFDFAFIAPVGNQPDFNYGRLQLSGLLTNGTTITTAFDFPGQDASGRFAFRAAGLDSGFRNATFRSLTFNACIFDEELNCVNSFANPAFYQAQFAIDNVDLDTVIPAPASFLLVGLGLGALALSRRRAAKASRSNNLQAQGI